MTLAITAIVTAYRRIGKTLVTLEKVLNCSPAPAEILVHVDGNERKCEEAVRRRFPEIGVLVSERSLGPRRSEQADRRGKERVGGELRR